MIKRVGDRLLQAFNDWFTSAAGMWQVTFLVLIIVGFEQLHVLHDDHGFWLLYWLTVFSGITQNALAYISRKSGDKQEQILHHLEKIVEHIDSERKG